MKEQLVSQLKTQITDLERFIEFLQGPGGENPGATNGPCICSVHNMTKPTYSASAGRPTSAKSQQITDKVRHRTLCWFKGKFLNFIWNISNSRTKFNRHSAGCRIYSKSTSYHSSVAECNGRPQHSPKICPPHRPATNQNPLGNKIKFYWISKLCDKFSLF